MDNYSDQLKALSDIRSMMEKSTKFVSLSGASGIAIGFLAIVTSIIIYLVMGAKPFEVRYFHKLLIGQEEIMGMQPVSFIALISILTIILALAIGFYFTYRKARKSNIKLWSKSFRLMLLNIGIPLFVGGLFAIALVMNDCWQLVAPATLVFYGLSLINGGKYTLQDVNSLGLAQILLGLIALFVPGYGFEFWIIGFGFFHIFYGAKIYFKQAKEETQLT